MMRWSKGGPQRPPRKADLRRRKEREAKRDRKVAEALGEELALLQRAANAPTKDEASA